MEKSARINGWTLSIGLGVAYNIAYSYVFFYVAYPFAIWKLGLAGGGLVMTSMSVALSYAAILVYDRTGRDWFGIETLKEKMRSLNGRTRTGRFLADAIRRSGPLALAALSIKFDPFVTTIYFRPASRRSSGLSGRDWAVFLSSAAIGNGYWLLVMFTGGSLLRYAGLGR
jgi:hypothetical protein